MANFHFDVPPAPKNQVSEAKFSIKEIVSITAPYVTICILEKQFFTARQVFDSHPVFAERGIKKANAIGDAMGARGYSFYRNTEKEIIPDFGNGSRVLAVVEDQEQLAKDVGYESALQLRLAVLKLGLADLTEEQKSAFASRMGFDSVQDLVQAINDLPARNPTDLEQPQQEKEGIA